MGCSLVDPGGAVGPWLQNPEKAEDGLNARSYRTYAQGPEPPPSLQDQLIILHLSNNANDGK